MGAVDVIDREGYAELEVDAKVELIRSLIPLGLMHIEELLDEEVTALAGERYARKDPSVGGRRHGSNPGTVGLAGQRVPIRVPRIRHLAEGLDETLTLHRLGVYGVLGRSLKTTNGLESINTLIEERCAKVDHWQNSSQRQRWLATALLDIEPRLRKVMGYRHLPRLRDALKRELKIDTTTSKTKAA